MTAYRRSRSRGGTWFFTICLEDRGSDLLVREIDSLRAAWIATARERPFRTGAAVVLPDHLHCVWTLPPGDTDFSTRWGAIKSRFTRAVKGRMGVHPILRPSQAAKGDAGIWQRRFWEHRIRSEDDYARHLEYCWINPVKHGLVRRVRDWEFSTFHREVRRGVVPAEWAGEFAGGGFGEAVRVR